MNGLHTINHIEENRGKDAAYEEARRHILRHWQQDADLWNSRFFERRTLDDGSRKLVPITERALSYAVDMADQTDEYGEYFYDDNGELFPCTFGGQTWNTDEDNENIVHGSGTIIANGKVVGHIHYTDH